MKTVANLGTIQEEQNLKMEKLVPQTLILAIVTLLALIGCEPGSAVREATMADAQDYILALKEELETYPSMSYDESGSGVSHNIKTMDFYFLISMAEFTANDLYVHAERALESWSPYEEFIPRGHGSGGGHGMGGNLFHLHFGSRKTHAFVDLTAYEADGEIGKIKIECLARVVE